MADVAKGIVDIEINTGDASAALKQLQQQINAFNMALSKQNKNQAIFAADYADQLKLAVEKTGLFTAETIRLTTAAATLDKTLGKGKSTLGQFFSAKFNKDSAMAAEVMALAAERAKAMQTQFIATSGASKGLQDALAIRPLAAFSSETAIAGQRAEILSSMFKQGTTQLINFGKNVQWAGRQLMVGFTVPLTIFGNTAGKTFMELEKQAVSFKKVYGDIFTTSAEVNKNLDAVTKLGEEYTKYGIAVKDTIGLAAQAAAAGRKNADLTDAVSQATRLATLGQMDQNAALETTISLQSAFRLSGKDLADTINFLNMVENQTVVSLQDIAAAIPRVAPVIQGLGGNVKDLTVFLAAMQEGGVDAAEGANALKSGLASLINPTKQAQEMLAGFGINLNAIIQANKGDLMGTVMAFSKALQNLDQFQRQQSLEQVFGKFQYAKLGALFDNISRQGSQAQQVIATMGYSTEQLGATADKELKTIEESFGVQLTGAIERFKLAIAPIGEIFVKTAIPIVNFVTRILDSFNQLSEGKKQFIAIATIITGVVVPAGTMLLGLLLNLTGTLAKIIQSFGAFSKGFITGGPIGAIRALTQTSKYFTLAEIDAANAAQQLAGASQAVNAAFLEQAAAAGVAGGAVNSLVNIYQKLIAAQTSAAGFSSFTTAGNAAEKSKGFNIGTAKFRGKGIRRNKGGLVPGVGNTDSIPAMLTPGESVVTKKATQKYGPLIDAMNKGKLPGFNGGVTDVSWSSAGDAIRGTGISLLDDIATPSQITRATGGKPYNIGNAPQGLLNELIQALVNAGAPNNIIEDLGRFISPTPRRGSYDFNNRLRTGEVTRREMASLFNLSRFTHGSGNAVSPFQYLYDEIGLSDTSIDKNIRRKAVELVSKTTRGTLFNDPDFGNLFIKAIEEADISQDSKTRLLDAAVSMSEKGARRAGSLGQFAERAGLKRALKSNGKEYNRPTFIFTGDSGEQIRVATGATLDITGRKSYQRMKNIPGYNRAHVISSVVSQLASRVIKLAGGGTVPGSGNKDSVPAMLTPGEFVVNKEAAAKNGQMLKAINNGNVRQYALGGVVNKAKSLAGSKTAKIAGSTGLMIGGGMAGQIIGGDMGSLIGSLIGPMLPRAAVAAASSLHIGAAAFASVAAPLALAGFAVYKFNQQINKAQNAGAEMTKAMYGTAKTTEDIAAAFGRQTFAQQARIAAVEKAAGSKISAEAQQASTGFIQSDAGKQLIKDIGTVKTGGGDAVEALRNQLSAAIISGAIGMEEANAIANEVGTAIGDQNIAVSVAGELRQLLGPDGKDILKNLSTITAEISPKIDATKLASDAQSAYEKLNAGAKFIQLFQGGAEGFKQDYKMSQISDTLSASYQREAEALQLLNLAYQQGEVSLDEYSKKRAELATSGSQGQDAVAKSLGFASYKDLVSTASEKGTVKPGARGGTTTTYTQQQQNAKNVIKAQSDDVKKMLQDLPGSTDEFVKKTMEGLNKIGGSSFGKILSGELSIADVNIVASWSGDLTPEELDKATENLQIMRTIPDAETKFNFDGVNAAEDMQNIIDKAKQIEKNPDIIKDFIANDKFSGVAKQFGLTYDMLAALDPVEIAVVMRNITTYETINASNQGNPGERAGQIRDTGVIDKIKASVKTGSNAISNALGGVTGSSGGGGGSAKKTLADMKKNLENRFDLVSKRLDLEASKYEKVNRQLERQNELDRRGIEAITKKEEAVNKAYELRINALDQIEQANDRIKQQEDSRINLAQALASGNIGAAAAAMNEIQSQNTANAIADTRAGLEEARQNALKNITVEINGQLLTREQIENRIEERELKMRANQDALYNIETKRLANAEALEKVQVRSYLLEQKKNIDQLNKKKKKLSSSEKNQLAEYKANANALAKAYGFDMQFMYGGMVKNFASGGSVAGIGNTDSVRAMLTPGEFVVRKSVAQQNMGLLNSLNNDIYPQLAGPQYSVPSSDFGTVSSGAAVSSTVYNDMYTINVNVAGTNTSADEIANVVMNKLSASNSGTIRSRRYGS